ncbi:hypothetical protein AB3662_01875 [Sorangium cellulosum]|uniref:hypothetical protein n=1 Tax=Sorangium cellulosum TaxID=56 RepID=UPI003D9A8700
MRTRLGICSLGLSLAALAAGCGGARGAIVDRQLAELRAELVRIRAENAVLADRVGSLELSRGGRLDVARAARAEAAGAAEARAASQEEPDRPDLEVVRLAPEAAPGTDAEPQTDGAARPPVLRSTAHGVVVDEPPGGTPPPSPPPSTLSRRKR